jgi:hypothetical protein
MKIEESKVRLEAGHEYEYRHSVETTGAYSFRSILQDIEASPPADAVDSAAAVAKTTSTESSSDEKTRIQMMLQKLVDAILEALSGGKCRCHVDDIAELKKNLPHGAKAPAADAGEPQALKRAPRAREFEWERTSIEHIEERERTQVSAEGMVRTADGREISFDLKLAMCREYDCTREQKESGKIVFKDPLVINFAGKAAELTDTRFNFDLDADGSEESVATLASGSGYLVFDADQNGRVNDGREMFGACGANAGDGFSDLARFDEDRNGWIDEADPAYAALGVWFPDGKIAPLKETGVGAINLASAYSPFALKDEDNVSRGQISRTGIYLSEDGQVGSVQQLDLGIRQDNGLPVAAGAKAGSPATVA